MKKLIFFALLALPGLGWGSQQTRGAMYFGFTPPTPSGGSVSTILNTSSTWVTFGFVPNESKSLSKVRLYVPLKTGTPAAVDAPCELSSDGGFIPGTLLESENTTSAVTSGVVNEWGPFTTALTAGTQYWLTFKNVNASPGTTNFTIRYGAGNTAASMQGISFIAGGWARQSTTTSGAAWTGVGSAGGTTPLIGYSDGTWDGITITQISNSGAADRIYASSQTGVLFTTPANTTLKVAGAVFVPGRIGSPVNGIHYNLYQGTSLLASSYSASSVTVNTTQGYMPLYFATVQTLAANTNYRLTMAQDGGTASSSSNGYFTSEYTIVNDTMTRTGFMWNAQKTEFNGSTWTDTGTTELPWALIADTNGEFAASAGTGGTKGFTFSQ